MRKLTPTLLLLSLSLLCLSCSDEAPLGSNDATPALDAAPGADAIVVSDSGPRADALTDPDADSPLDASPASTDTGSTDDASISIDSGAPDEDGSAPPEDASTETDSGAKITDADVAPEDSSAPIDDAGASPDAILPGDDAAAPNADATVSEDASPADDAAATNPDATVTNPDATVTNPDATVTNSDATVTNPDATNPDATVTNPDATVTNPDATPIDTGVTADSGIFADASGVDTGVVDTGVFDTGLDAGPVDTGYDAGSLADFCAGAGSVVQIGAGGECSGTVAENTFRFAVCSCEDLEANSNLAVDAFDSDLGIYGGANVLADGDIGVNGQLAMPGRLDDLGSVFVSGGGFAVGGQSYVALNVFANGSAIGAAAETRIDRNMYLNGNVTGRFSIEGDLTLPVGATVDPGTTVGGATIHAPLPPIEPCACAPSDILDVAALVDFGAQFNDNAQIGLNPDAWATDTGPSQIVLPCGRYYLRGIQHSNSLEIRAAGRTVLYVDGDFNASGSLRLTIDPGAELDLFVSGSLIPGAALRFGDESQPTRVRTYVGGSGAIAMSGSSVFGGFLYAPRSDIQFTSAATIYGGVFGRYVRFDASSHVHFDSAIRHAGDTCEPPPPDAGVDAGSPTDATPSDAGAPTDATADAGAPDAGDLDAAAPDAGDLDASAPDTGVPPQLCSKCYDCAGTLACLIDPGAPVGTCGACRTDLDCCAGELCIGGSCAAF